MSFKKKILNRRQSLGAALLGSVRRQSDGDEPEVRPPPVRQTANRRSSISLLLFGGGPSPKSSSASANPPPTVPEPPRRRLSKGQLFADVPVDSRAQHSFRSAFSSDDEAHSDDNLFDDSVTRVAVVASPTPFMRKVMRVVVTGGRKTGKTAFLQQIACFNDITTSDSYTPTIDDTYQVQTLSSTASGAVSPSGDGSAQTKEVIVFHDTGGVTDFGVNAELRRAYLQVADAFLLFYSVTDHESFNRMDVLKHSIDRYASKERREVIIVVVGTMTDLPGRQVDSTFANSWATREKVKLFEVSAKNRVNLVDVVHSLVTRFFHPIKESKFSLSKKLRSEKSVSSSYQISS